MKQILFCLFFSTLLLGQTTLTLTGPVSVTTGDPASLTLTLAGSSGQNIAALQWSTTLPSGITYGAPVISTTLAAAGDQVYCGAVICLIAGALSVMSDGTIATILVNFSDSVSPGVISLPLVGLVAATPSGLNVNALASGPVYSPKVLSPCDLNQDGVVNVTDVQLAIVGTIGTGSCPISSGIGGCSLTTVVYEIIAATGGGCKLGTMVTLKKVQ